jgi:hypothetical protein
MKVMLHELFTPLLVASAVMSCANNSGARAGETMVEAEIGLSIKGHEPVKAQTAYTDSFAIRSLAIDIMGLFGYLMGNGFEEISFDQVRVSLTLTDERRAAYITDGFIGKKEFKPGETVNVSLKIKPSLGEEYIETIDIIIPEDVRNEEVRITIADGGTESANRISSNSYVWNPRSVDEILQGIDMVKAPASLVVKMYKKGRGVSVSGGDMPAVPPSFLSVVGESQPHRVKRDADSPFYERVIESDRMLRGSLTFVVQVKEK